MFLLPGCLRLRNSPGNRQRQENRAALHRAPELVRGFLEKILAPKQERTMDVQQRNRRRGQDVEL